jgi:hypothetical protein
VAATDVTLRILSDDGARVYVNTAIQYDDVVGKQKAKYWNIKKAVPGGGSGPPLGLKAGNNTIAVQVRAGGGVRQQRRRLGASAERSAAAPPLPAPRVPC